jgi:hypothetical protein
VSGAVTTWRPILRTAIRALPAGESVTELSATDAWKTGALPMIPDYASGRVAQSRKRRPIRRDRCGSSSAFPLAVRPTRRHFDVP